MAVLLHRDVANTRVEQDRVERSIKLTLHNAKRDSMRFQFRKQVDTEPAPHALRCHMESSDHRAGRIQLGESRDACANLGEDDQLGPDRPVIATCCARPNP